MNNAIVLPLLLFTVLHFPAGDEPGQTEKPGWPGWRGEDHMGIWYDGPDLDTLDEQCIQVLWEHPVSPGYSGPTVSGDFVYLMDRVDRKERVLCLSAKNGMQVWEYSYPVEYSVGYPVGPRASVLIQDGKAYSFGTMGHLHCFNSLTGELIWKVNGMDTYHSEIPIWGMASNLVIHQDLLIVQLGGKPGACLVAFQKDTGKEIWRALDEDPSYSAPTVIKQAGKNVLVCWTGESISGLNPLSGKCYWKIPFEPVKMIMNVASPVYSPPYLFLTAFFDGSYLVKVDQETLSAELVYHRVGKSERETDALHSTISTPVIRGDYVYGVDSYGEVRCLDLKTGDRVWEDRSLVPEGRWVNIHFVREGDKIWGFNEKGDLLMGKFSPDGYMDLGKVHILDPVKISPNPRNGVCWAHPAFSGNRIYFRNDEKLVCVEVNRP